MGLPGSHRPRGRRPHPVATGVATLALALCAAAIHGDGACAPARAAAAPPAHSAPASSAPARPAAAANASPAPVRPAPATAANARSTIAAAANARPAPATAANALRALCQGWGPDSSVAPLSGEVRLQPLRYGDGQLRVDLSRPTTLEEGAQGLVELVPAAPAEASAAMPMNVGAQLLRDQASGKLTFRLAFLPERAPLTGSPCFTLSGGRVLRVRVVPLWASLTQGGREVARLHTERGEGLKPEGRPDAQLDTWGLIFEGDGHDREGLGAALQPLPGKALSCYEQALSQQPDLSGRVILGAEVDREGRVTDVRVEVDAIGEAELTRCLRESTLALRLPRLKRPAHLSLPLVLRRTSPLSPPPAPGTPAAAPTGP